MKISEVAKLTGITVRTLHYYDEIGLLKPSEITESGYRLYSKDSLETLQQILLFKELDFPLNEIKEIITNPNYNKGEALNKQKELLVKKRQRIDSLIGLINNTIEGENNMSFKEFDMKDIEESKKKYAKEVKERWGNTDAYKECEEKTNNYSENQWGAINKESSEILKDFGQHIGCDPGSEEVQDLVEKWRNHISSSYYNCTKEILSGLGLMYINDERFQNNIDQNGQGTAELMSKAIEIYCSK
ncbi:MerR family transcriptional regulator [Terrisporobacter petrolearius]|uniref:MerR family transcriptional regulator n=1 Tax=Terrisporobacter petrolearius TaxID=1460447 RepID=UPI003B009775